MRIVGWRHVVALGAIGLLVLADSGISAIETHASSRSGVGITVEQHPRWGMVLFYRADTNSIPDVGRVFVNGCITEGDMAGFCTTIWSAQDIFRRR